MLHTKLRDPTCCCCRPSNCACPRPPAYAFGVLWLRCTQLEQVSE
eukprot:SAG31_NODE_37102_length_307_cov_0.750000_1_plen_44_part_01